MAFTHIFVIGDSLVDAGNALGLAEWYDDLPFQSLPEGAPTAGPGLFSRPLLQRLYLRRPGFEQGDRPRYRTHLPLSFRGSMARDTHRPVRERSDRQQHQLRLRRLAHPQRRLKSFRTSTSRPTPCAMRSTAHIPSNALIIVTMGGNDVRDLAPTGTDPVPQAAAYAELRECAIQLQHELSQLIGDGARNICITGIADVGLIPRYDRDGDGVLNATEQMRSDAATDYSIYLDTLIRTQVVPALQAHGRDRHLRAADGLCRRKRESRCRRFEREPSDHRRASRPDDRGAFEQPPQPTRTWSSSITSTRTLRPMRCSAPTCSR